MTENEIASIPPGPADTEYPSHALARLALSKAAQQAAETATALVDTLADDILDNVEFAAQLMREAQQVLDFAVVCARETPRPASWENIGGRLGSVTRQSAQEKYGRVIAWWEKNLDRPWDRIGSERISQLPESLDTPAPLAASLDKWCSQYAHTLRRERAEREGVGNRMVSANLPAHTDATRIQAVTRHSEYLAERERCGYDVAEQWADHRRRQQEVYDSVAEIHRGRLASWNHRDNNDEN